MLLDRYCIDICVHVLLDSCNLHISNALLLLLLYIHTYFCCNIAAQRLDWDNIKHVIKANVIIIKEAFGGLLEQSFCRLNSLLNVKPIETNF